MRCSTTGVELQNSRSAAIQDPPVAAGGGNAIQILGVRVGIEAWTPLGQRRAIRVQADDPLAAAIDVRQTAIWGDAKTGRLTARGDARKLGPHLDHRRGRLADTHL